MSRNVFRLLALAVAIWMAIEVQHRATRDAALNSAQIQQAGSTR